MKHLLGRFGRWLVNKFDPAPPPPVFLPSVARFQVFTVHYAGELGGDARRAHDRAKGSRAIGDTGVLYFMDGDECRGRTE